METGVGVEHMSLDICQARESSQQAGLLWTKTANAKELAIAIQAVNVQKHSEVSHCLSVLVFTSQFLHRASRRRGRRATVCDSGFCASDSMMLIICPRAERERGEAEMGTETEMDRKRA